MDKVRSHKDAELARERVCADQGASGADKVIILTRDNFVARTSVGVQSIGCYILCFRPPAI